MTHPLRTVTLGIGVDVAKHLVEEVPFEPNGGPLKGSTVGCDGLNVDAVENLNKEGPREGHGGQHEKSTRNREPSTSRVGVEDVHVFERLLGTAGDEDVGGDQEVAENGGPTRSFTGTTARPTSTSLAMATVVTTTRRGMKWSRERLIDDKSEGRQVKRTC